MRRSLALAFLATVAVAGAFAYYQVGEGAVAPLPAAGQPWALEAVVNPGEGLVVWHPLGARLRVLPQTFDRPTRVRMAPEEVFPLSHSLAASVWSLEADGADFARPIELVLPLHTEASQAEAVETFAVFWDGAHWSRSPGLVPADGSAVRVLATHFSLWSVGQDPVTHLGNDQTAPSILLLSIPAEVESGQELEVGYAVANLGPSDLEGYGEVTVSLRGAGGVSQASSGALEDWDGADGPLGSIAYVAGIELTEALTGIAAVDAATLAPLRVPAGEPGLARAQVRLTFYDTSGRPVSSATAERVITVRGAGDSAGEAPEVVRTPVLPERVDTVREPGAPLSLHLTGVASEDFDDAATFTGAEGRDVAREWGAYQTGVVAQFTTSSAGLEQSRAQVLRARGATRVGIMRPVAGLRRGEPHHIQVQYRLEVAEESESLARVRLGVDPFGGTDPTAVSVVWAEGAVHGAWTSLMLTDVLAEGDVVTVFLELSDPEPGQGSTAYLDALEVQAEHARQMPDLAVEGIWAEIPPEGVCEGSPARLMVQVRNRGGGRASSFNTVVGGVDGACGPWRVRGLESGEAFVFACELSEPGSWSVRVITDASNSVAETDENNNWLQRDVLVAACLPTATPAPTATRAPAVTPAPLSTAARTNTPTAEPASASAPSGCREAGAPLCLGSVVRFRYLDADWTLSLDGWRREPDPTDARWVKVVAWGTMTRHRRHDVERLLATTGDADLGRILGLTLVDDHGHSHVASEARLEGPLSVPARLQFEDLRNLWGRFYFEVSGFPSPSAISGATVRVGLPALSADGIPLEFLYLPGEEEGEAPRRVPTAAPSLPPGAMADEEEIEVMAYLTLSADAQASADGGLLTIDLRFGNQDYVALRPDLGPALVINSDWQYGAYLGRGANQPVNWRQAAAVWEELSQEGVPPLTGGDSAAHVLRAYALAPAGREPWEDPVLWFPGLGRALRLRLDR